jgi:hypothetical protein
MASVGICRYLLQPLIPRCGPAGAARRLTNHQRTDSRRPTVATGSDADAVVRADLAELEQSSDHQLAHLGTGHAQQNRRLGRGDLAVAGGDHDLLAARPGIHRPGDKLAVSRESATLTTPPGVAKARCRASASRTSRSLIADPIRLREGLPGRDEEALRRLPDRAMLVE